MCARYFVLLALAAAGAAQTPWWAKEPLRIIDLTTSLDRIDWRDPARLAREKAALGYNAEHLEIMAMPKGLDDAHFFFKTGVASRTNPDYLRAYMAEAHKQGIRVFIYFNVHWYRREFAERHPDWRQIKEDLRPVDDVYQTGSDFCVNTGWRKWCFQILRDLAAYKVDGIFYDGPIYRADTCYCTACREKFRLRYGRDLPSKKARSGRDFKDLLDFQAASLAEFLRDSRQVLKSINPEIALYMNGGVRGGNWATARLNRVLVEEQDLLGSEGGFIYSDLTRIPLWKPGLTARLLETQAGGKPTVIFSAAAHKPWTFSILPAPELRLLYADSIANAAGVWFGITPYEFDQPEMQPLAEMNRFLQKNAAYYTGTRSEAGVALVWSDTTANFYAGADAQLIDVNRVPQRSDVGNLDAEFNGLADALLRAHTPFDVIDDTRLEREPLERYRLLVLPNVACMSELAARRVGGWVRAGGTLLATFETSLYDDTGVRRADFALAEVLGVSDRKRILGPTRWDFARPRQAHPILAGLGREFIPSSLYRVRTRPTTAQVLWQYTEPLAGPYDGVPPLAEDPALTVNRAGRGTAIYAAGDLGGGIAQFHTPELMELVANIVRHYAPAPFELAGVPSSVELVWRSQQTGAGKRSLLHLVNFTGEMTRPIRRILPVQGANLTLRSDIPVRRAHTLVQARELVSRRDSRGQTVLALPQIDEYEVIVIEH